VTAAAATGGYPTVRSVGALLPADLLARVVAGTDLPGLSPDNYHLAGEPVRQAASRAFEYSRGVYARFRDELARRPGGDAGTGLTRERWLQPLLGALYYGRVPATPGGHLNVDGRDYPISHLWADVPVHLLGWGVDLDARTGRVAGAARAPQSMVQELLNRSPDHLWAVLSNGRTLRLLRDSSALVGQSYSSSTWRRSSTGTCSATSSCCSCSATSPGWSGCQDRTGSRAASRTDGWSAGAPTRSTPAPGR
jgi:hypothetical protein